jgi:hypothetical protein
MLTRGRSVALASLAAVLSVHAVPGFAQTNSVSLADARYASTTAARIYVATRGRGYDDRPRTSNVTVAPLYQPVVAQMLERSATFRRQWARVARASNVAITLRNEIRASHNADAWTTITRGADGRTRQIIISVIVGPRTAELIAHEFEHIVEQLDGVDLRQKAAMRASGVRTCDCGATEMFETKRAIAVGQQVAREVIDASRGQ